jgi:hypothetical protein
VIWRVVEWYQRWRIDRIERRFNRRSSRVKDFVFGSLHELNTPDLFQCHYLFGEEVKHRKREIRMAEEFAKDLIALAESAKADFNRKGKSGEAGTEEVDPEVQ